MVYVQGPREDATWITIQPGRPEQEHAMQGIPTFSHSTEQVDGNPLIVHEGMTVNVWNQLDSSGSYHGENIADHWNSSRTISRRDESSRCLKD
jgi:hypothetical protein